MPSDEPPEPDEPSEPSKEKPNKNSKTGVNYGPLTAIPLTIGSYFFSQILAVLAVGLIPLVLGFSQADTNNWLGETNSVSRFLIILLVAIINVGIIRWFLTSRSTALKKIGVNKFQVKYLLSAGLGFAGYFVIISVLLIVLSVLVPSLDLNQEQELGFDKSTTGQGLVLIFISLVILPPLVEEFVMRGFLFTGLRQKLPFVGATLITSVLFATAHLPGGTDSLLWVGALDTFVLSVILCYLREKHRSLWPPIGLHMLKNALAFSIVFGIFSW